MRILKKYRVRLCVGILGVLMFTACDLNYDNTKVINLDDIWTDKVLISAYLSDIHGEMMPGWSASGDGTDEGINRPGSLGDYQRGFIDAEKTGKGLTYENMEKINFFLDQLATVPETVLAEEEKEQLAGQALFWRAWDYWDKVTVFGGVPLILNSQDITDKESLFVPRSKTSVCVARILRDLDDAIAKLPEKWDDANYGRIDKGAALAFKGKVLMWYASPLFNPTQDMKRWEVAYEANKAAVDFLRKTGKGLFADFSQLWYKERNEEVVMVNQFYYPDHTGGNWEIRPEQIGGYNSNQLILSMLMAFPKKDGTMLELEIDRLEDPSYNAGFLTQFYDNRDDRFYATVFCGGNLYPAPDSKVPLWYTWRKVTDSTLPDGYKYVSMAQDQIQASANYGISGFFTIKGLDKSLDQNRVLRGGVDWIEIRFAEVLMNYGECANEIGKPAEALQVLYDIRKRAGIEAGNGSYGITATSQENIRKAYMDERLVEFAFEGKRWGDLRRWKRFDLLNKMKYRSGLYVTLKNEAEMKAFDYSDQITDPEIRKKFKAVYIENLDMDPLYKFNLDLSHWFYPLNKDVLDRNSRLEQNNEWGGTFDPLE